MVVIIIFAVLTFIALILFLTEHYYRGDNPFDPEKHFRRFHYDRHAYKDHLN